MVCIRPAKTTDLLEMQHCNLYNLPENYNLRYWMYHMTSWSALPQVAIDEYSGKIVGYVLGKMEDEEIPDPKAKVKKEHIMHGHITSISVLRDYRKLGVATKLMRACHEAMKSVYEAKYVSLHVRISNAAAIQLYFGILNYEKNSIATSYYADGEDAFDMIHYFDRSVRPKVRLEKKKDHVPLGEEEEVEEHAGNEIQT